MKGITVTNLLLYSTKFQMYERTGAKEKIIQGKSTSEEVDTK
jgi:hypothetical protein